MNLRTQAVSSVLLLWLSVQRSSAFIPRSAVKTSSIPVPSTLTTTFKATADVTHGRRNPSHSVQLPSSSSSSVRKPGTSLFAVPVAAGAGAVAAGIATGAAGTAAAASSGAGGLLALIASTPLASLAILAFIILVHEGGHYLAARGFRIRVEEFSIGIGPKLAGFKAFGDEFNLRAFPLGGFVRFPENYDALQVRQQEIEAMRTVDQFTRERLTDPKEKVMNLLTLGAVGDKLIQQENQRRLEEQAKQLAAQEQLEKMMPWWKKRLGGAIGAVVPGQLSTTSAAALTPIVGPDDIEIQYFDDPQLLQNRPWFERAVVISGGVIFNFLLAFSIYFGIIHFGTGLPEPIFTQGAVVTAQPRPETAASGILRAGDVILQVNGQDLVRISDTTTTTTSAASPTFSQAQQGINDFIQTIRNTPSGEALKLTVLHPNEMAPVEVVVQPKVTTPGGPQSIGVLLTPNFVKTEMLRSDSVVEAAGMAAKYTNTLIQQTAAGFLSILTGFVSGLVGTTASAGAGGGSITGPIGLIKVASEIVSTQDWTAVLLFTAALSVNLGVVNAFPLPALDGGQLVFVLMEAVSGRKVNQRTQEAITSATLLFLLFISIGAAVGDLENIFASAGR